MSMAKIVDNYYQFEAWSRYIIDHLFVLHKNNKKIIRIEEFYMHYKIMKRSGTMENFNINKNHKYHYKIK